MSEELAIERIMQRGLLTCEPDTPLWMAAERMASRQCSSIVVVEAGQPVGIWTENDAMALDFSAPDAVRQPISWVMSQPVVSLHVSTPVSEAALRFNAERRRHFLVVDNDEALVGIVTQTDVVLNQGLEPYLRLREVESAMRKRVLVLEGQARLAQAARSMRLAECDAVIVKCADGELGILTERDLVRFVAQHPGDGPIEALASRPLMTVSQSDTLIAARDLLMRRRIRHLGVLDAAGEVVGLLSFRDMLAGAEYLYLEDLRKALEQRDRALAQSRMSRQLAERIIDSSLEGIIIADSCGRIEFVNHAFTHMSGYSAEEVIGKTPAVLSSGRHDADFYRQMWEALRRDGCWRGEVWNRRKNGELYLELLTITAITDDSGAVSNYAAIFNDITHLRENEEQIRKLAYYDALTGLPNRRLLEDRLKLAIRHAHRTQSRLAVIFIDLDHFKQVNDTLGHAFGDELLVMMAERLRESLREDDTLARLGGDEFLVLLPRLEEIDEVTRIARRLIEVVSEPCVIEGQEFRLGCSLGISLYPDDATTANMLVHNADIAMYRAKQEGRNGYRLYRNEMNLHDDRQRALEQALRTALKRREGLQLLYQPIIEDNSGRLHAAEALLRWHHPLLGAVSPTDIVLLAEKAGLLEQLGDHVFEQVCAQLAVWRRAGKQPVPVNINLSARQLLQQGLAVRVASRLKAHDLPPGLLGFEIGECALMGKNPQAVTALKRLQGLGGEIALNDFGAGDVAIGSLQELPISTIKLKPLFVQRLDSEQRGSTALLAAITGLARELDLRVVAVGVENKAQRDILARHGVNLLQGYLVGRPLPASSFAERYLTTEHRVAPSANDALS